MNFTWRKRWTSMTAIALSATFAMAAMLSASASAQVRISAPQPLLGDGLLLTGSASATLFPEPPASGLSGDSAGLPELVAPKHDKYIPAGYAALPLTPHDKVILGMKDLYSPFTFLGDLASAGYSHVLNGQPNYGTNSGAFGQRLGATVIRDASEGVFADIVFSPLLHEDPRYYVEGPQYGFIHRVLYAGTRPIVTRADSGHNTINGEVLLGYAASSALSYTYYPTINQNFHDTAATYGGSLAGAAVGFLVSEFSDQVLQALHLEKKK